MKANIPNSIPSYDAMIMQNEEGMMRPTLDVPLLGNDEEVGAADLADAVSSLQARVPRPFSTQSMLLGVGFLLATLACSFFPWAFVVVPVLYSPKPIGRPSSSPLSLDDGFGRAVALNSNGGSVLAVAGRKNTQVFERTNRSSQRDLTMHDQLWAPKGGIIQHVFDDRGVNFCNDHNVHCIVHKVELSSDGNLVAILRSVLVNGTAEDGLLKQYMVDVRSFNGTNWIEVGSNPITISDGNSNFADMAFSKDGSTIVTMAYGGPINDAKGTGKCEVGLFHYNERVNFWVEDYGASKGPWMSVENCVYGSVALSGDGRMFAVGFAGETKCKDGHLVVRKLGESESYSETWNVPSEWRYNNRWHDTYPAVEMEITCGWHFMLPGASHGIAIALSDSAEILAITSPTEGYIKVWRNLGRYWHTDSWDTIRTPKISNAIADQSMITLSGDGRTIVASDGSIFVDNDPFGWLYSTRIIAPSATYGVAKSLDPHDFNHHELVVAVGASLSSDGTESDIAIYKIVPKSSDLFFLVYLSSLLPTIFLMATMTFYFCSKNDKSGKVLATFIDQKISSMHQSGALERMTEKESRCAAILQTFFGFISFTVGFILPYASGFIFCARGGSVFTEDDDLSAYFVLIPIILSPLLWVAVYSALFWIGQQVFNGLRKKHKIILERMKIRNQVAPMPNMMTIMFDKKGKKM